jgi:predicted ATP-grasp superfamily ATP-dependent carboligase
LTHKSVLIAALSGRALAASTRRAGFTALVVDAFGDSDMQEAAGAFRCLPDAASRGFRAGSLLPALRELARTARHPPVGLVLGSGFEDTPKLVAALARNFTLLGTGADAIARAKQPQTFFPLLDRLRIAHPETRLDAPDNLEGWLSKRIGGSGGSHVLDVSGRTPMQGRYFQRRLDGSPASLLAVACGHKLNIVGFSQQWTVGTGPRPYRYGGAAGPARLGEEIEARMAGAAWALNRALGLAGLVSFDFLVNGEDPFLLEVNPRPGATLDVFDDGKGSLFAAHIAACLGQNAVDSLRTERTPGARAAGVLYAQDRPFTVSSLAWPDWAADRPNPGTTIPRYRPIASVQAEGETALAAQANCRQRLDELAHMLYGRATDTEHNDAKIRRPRTERFGTSGQAR